MDKAVKPEKIPVPSFLEACRPQSPTEAKARWICLALTAAMLVMVFGVTGNYNWMTLYVVGGWTTMIVAATYFLKAAWELKRTGTFTIAPYPSIMFFNLLSGINIAAFNPIKGWLNQFGFWADPLLANTERALLFGHDAWVFLTWLPAYWTVVFYGRIWFIVTLLLVPVAAYRRQYRMIILYFLIWGPLALIPQALFQSGGPIFWDNLGYGDRFADIPYRPGVLVYADYLWDRYSNGMFGIGTGISAMPSVHVMIATWVMLVFRDTALKIPAIGFFVLTFSLSIAFGWHYALDGIVGALLVIVAFKLLAPFGRARNEAVPQPR